MSTCNRLDLQTLGSQPTMPKNLPDHWFKPPHDLQTCTKNLPNMEGFVSKTDLVRPLAHKLFELAANLIANNYG